MQEQILSMLVDAAENGDICLSGSKIAEQLGISRAAIWKHMQTLRQRGAVLEAVPKKGYTLKNGGDLLLPGAVKFKTKVIGRSYTYMPYIDSTNLEAKRRARQGAPEGLVVLAEDQGAGRGRMGRQWHSVAGKGLYFSVVLRPPDMPLHQAPLLTPVVAAAVRKALATHTGLEVVIKWPNDLLVSGRKLGGILLEAGGEADRLSYGVIGIGLNVNLAPCDLPPALRETATSVLIEKGQPVRRRLLFQDILTYLDEYYLHYLAEGSGGILAEYKSHCHTLGRRVSLQDDRGIQVGRAVELAGDGSLIVQLDEGDITVVRAGDVHCL